MTSFGTQVKQDQLRQVLEATGKDEYIVFCYDRYYLGASSEEIATLLDVEMPTLEPAVSPIAANTLLKTMKTTSKTTALSQHCELYLSLFAKFDSFSQILMKTMASHTILAKTLVEEQKSQSMALNVALTNLETHSEITNRGVQDFYNLAEKELHKQSALLNTADIDLNILRDIQIHPAFISYQTNNNDNIDMGTTRELDKQHSLKDYVDMNQLQTARQDTEDLCQHLTHDIHFLRSVVGELKNYEEELRHQISSDHNLHTLDTMLMDIQDTRDKAQFLRDKIKRDLNRIYSKIADLLQVPLSSLFANLSLDASTTSTSTSTSNTPAASLQHIPSQTPPQALADQSEPIPYSTLIRRNSSSPASHDTASAFPSQTKKTLEAFYHLAEIHVNDYLPKLTSYESTIRQLITKLTQLKRQSIQKFLKNMTTISQLQSDIAATSPQLDMANKSLLDFKDKYGSSYLETSRDMLFAYGALMIEVLRRKEYALILIENANLIADVFGRFREQEQDRRNFFRRDILNVLPFNISNINDAAPQIEISTSKRGDSGPLITRKDIIDFVALLDRSYSEAVGKHGQSNVGKATFKETDRKSGTYTSTQMAITNDSYGQNLLNLLNNMNKQLDGLNMEFLKMIESTPLLDSGNPKMELGTASHRLENVVSTSKISSERSLQLAEDKLKKYEERIASLEKTLQQYQTALSSSHFDTLRHTTMNQEDNRITYKTSPSAIGSSSVSSAYSVLNDNEMDDPKNSGNLTDDVKRISGKQHQHQTTTEQEINDLKETIQQREAFINKMHEQLLQEQHINQDYRDQAEHDKEDMLLQIQEYEQLLEEERQTYEDNRKSFLKEAQIKDNLADIRIADIESDWKTKVMQLTEALSAEKQSKSDMEARHRQELLEMQDRHEKELAKSKTQLEISHNNEKSLLNQALEEIRSEYMEYRQQTSVSKKEADDKLNELVSEMNNSEEARNEIKQRLAQARDMVSRAENDWMEKQEALEKLKKLHDKSCSILVGLVTKVNGDLTQSFYKQDDGDMLGLLGILGQELNAVTMDTKNTIEKLFTLENNYKEACQHIEVMEEEKLEWHSTSVHMAQKLDDIRKNVFFEVINQLQLPVDENEVGAMTRKLSIMDPTTQHDISVFHDILTAMNVIDSGKFVSRVFKKVKNAHELTRRWQKEYKELKEKYTKLTTSAHEKIAFRNFKTGDVALFLPTRNSTGKPWAAFNVNAPHYFLKPSESVSSQMSSREWIVARITSITECLVNAQDSTTNPYGLPDKAVFYQLEVENWRNGRPKHHHRKSKHAKSSPSNSSSSSTTTSAVNISDNSNTNVNSQRRYTLPTTHSANHHHSDIGLASISSSVIEKSTQLDNSTISQQQQQHSRLPSPPGPFTRSSSSSIVQSTTLLSSPPSSGDQNFYKDNKPQQPGASSSTTDGIDPSLIWASGE
ncbi:unnamed protein product [Absidia cylindrospora]